jgi:hypothetical protein
MSDVLTGEDVATALGDLSFSGGGLDSWATYDVSVVEPLCIPFWTINGADPVYLSDRIGVGSSDPLGIIPRSLWRIYNLAANAPFPSDMVAGYGTYWPSGDTTPYIKTYAPDYSVDQVFTMGRNGHLLALRWTWRLLTKTHTIVDGSEIDPSWSHTDTIINQAAGETTKGTFTIPVVEDSPFPSDGTYREYSGYLLSVTMPVLP